MAGEKGTYRSIYSAIWEDPEFQSFGPDMMLVFLSLRTGRECNFPCIFPFYLGTLSERMKLPQEKIDAAFNALIEAGWIAYERPILWIRKGLRNDPNFVPQNSKQIYGISNILNSLPKLDIVKEFATYYQIPSGSDARIDAPPGQGKEKEPEREPEKEKKPKKESAPFELPAIISAETWANFEEHRKKLRKPMTDKARDLIVKEIMKLGQDPDELLEQSIRKGWQDVFPLKDAPAAPKVEPEQVKGPKVDHYCYCGKVATTRIGEEWECDECIVKQNTNPW